MEQARELGQGDDTYEARVSGILSTILGMRFEQPGSIAALNSCSIAVLNRAVDLASQAVDAVLEDHLFRADMLNSLGILLGRRFERTSSIDDLNRAVNMASQAIDSSPQHHPRRAIYVVNLALWLGRRFEWTDSMDDLNRAVEVAGEAVDATPQDHPYRAAILNSLGGWLATRFGRTGSMDDLNRAVEVAGQAVDATHPDHPDQARSLSTLGNSLGMRFQRTGSMDDLNRAVEVAGETVDLTPQDHPYRAALLNSLATWLGKRFERTGSMDDLNRAIDIAGDVADTIPQDHTDRAAMLNNLGNWLGRRFQRTGSMDDLNRAVDAAGEAIGAAPPDHPDRAVWLNSLGNWLGTRSERTGSMDDLNRAVEVAGQAVDATPPDHPDRARFLSTLGISLGMRFQRTNYMGDLNRAIEVAGEAVDATPPDHPDRAATLNNLGTWLGKRFERTGSVDDLNRAVEVAGQAVDATPKTHYDRSGRLNNLGIRLGRRFERTGSMDDLNRAIEVAGEAVDATPPDHPDRAATLNNLGTWLGKRFKRTGSMDDLNRQLSSCKLGWHCYSAAPSVRIRVAWQAAQILATRLDWQGSSQLLQEAVNLLPTINPRWSEHTDKQDMLVDFAGLASEAASTVLNAQKSAYDALQLLELGRGVIASLLMEMRGDISDLQKQHADLAGQFISLRDELDSPADSSTPLNFGDDASSSESRVKRRREAAEGLSEVISRIRAQPGFEEFLLAPTADELMAAANLGPVIVINLSPYRCDAFLLERHQIQVLELPGLTVEGVQERARQLRSFPLLATYHVTPLLEWLWDAVARPILEKLGFDNPIADNNWPHVWWVATGLLSQLPLHAAGYHTRGGYETVLDRVMSSYASSVKALIHGRRVEVRRSVGPLSGDALLVGMPETPDLSANRILSFVTDEIEMVQKLCHSLGLRPIIPMLRKDDVLNHLQSCRIFHFAGHGQSDPDEPSRSCLLLEDWKTNPLTVGDLRDYRLQKAPPFLGFLSACSTGANKVDGLVDEGIHLVGAFQLAGFRHVVGTLWEVSDQHSVDVARLLYETMQDEGMTDAGVCRGLHRAIRALRNLDVGVRSMGKEGGSAGRTGLYDSMGVAEAINDEMAEDGAQTWMQTRGHRDPGRVRRKAGQDMSLLWVPYVHFGV